MSFQQSTKTPAEALADAAAQMAALIRTTPIFVELDTHVVLALAACEIAKELRVINRRYELIAADAADAADEVIT